MVDTVVFEASDIAVVEVWTRVLPQALVHFQRILASSDSFNKREKMVFRDKGK